MKHEDLSVGELYWWWDNRTHSHNLCILLKKEILHNQVLTFGHRKIMKLHYTIRLNSIEEFGPWVPEKFKSPVIYYTT